MLDKDLVARAADRLRNPTPRTPERDRLLFASMAAESLKLEGIDTSIEEVLASAGVTPIEQAHAVA